MTNQLDLFQKAEENAALVEAQYAEIETEPGVRAFADIVYSEACVSMNRKPEILINILEKGEILNSRMAVSMSGLSRDEWTAKEHGPVKERRMTFDRAFNESDLFMYGALNLGGIGTTGKVGHFGNYCLILKQELFLSEGCAVGCVKADCLNDEYWVGNDLNSQAFLLDLAPFQHRGKLAALKLKARLDGDLVGRYAEILISKRDDGRDEYVEVIFMRNQIGIGVEFIKAIRVSKTFVNKEAVKSYDPMAPKETRDHPAFQYHQIKHWCAQRNLPLEPVS